MDQGFQFNSFSLQVFVKLTSVFISGSMSYDFLSFKTWYTLDLSPIHVRFLHACTQSLISYASSCWQGCWHCCLRVLDCLSLPRNLMPLPYHVGSLNDIHFQRQCRHQRYILASWRHAALHCFDWSWLPLCWAAFLIFPIRSLCWEIWYVFSVTGTVEERR